MDDFKKSQACPQFEAVLEDYVSDELSATERESVAAHLQVCSPCAVTVQSVLHARSILRFAGEAAEDPGPFFTRRVMSGILALEQKSASERGFWKPLEVFAMRAVWASAGAIALLVLFANLSVAPEQPRVAQVRPADQVGLFSEPSAVPSSRDELFLNITDVRHGE